MCIRDRAQSSAEAVTAPTEINATVVNDTVVKDTVTKEAVSYTHLDVYKRQLMKQAKQGNTV